MNKTRPVLASVPFWFGVSLAACASDASNDMGASVDGSGSPSNSTLPKADGLMTGGNAGSTGMDNSTTPGNGGSMGTGGSLSTSGSGGGSRATGGGGLSSGANNAGSSSGLSAGGGSMGGAMATGGAMSSGGMANGGVMASGGGMANGGAAMASGGAMATGGAMASGGAMDNGGSGGMAGSGGSSDGGVALPCDVLEQGGQTCVSAHSTVRVLISGYTGPLYQVCSGRAAAGPGSCQGMTQDIGAVDGYADVASQEAFCSGSCTISKIYDQSGQGNDLEPAPRGGAKGSPDNPADAAGLPVTVSGHSVYGILVKPGIGYRTGCTGCTIKTGHGIAVGDEPETMYMVTSQQDLVNDCCFDYGNAETSSNDDGNGTMETLYFGDGVIWGSGAGNRGPWVMADLENGLYAGWENGQDKNISTNQPLRYDFVTAVVVGDTADKNNGKGRFALYGGDATSGELTTMYDGVRPAKPGYVPMQKQGSIILGIGGDNSNSAGGRFYEGVVASGAASKQTLDALQNAIVAAGYGK